MERSVLALMSALFLGVGYTPAQSVAPDSDSELDQVSDEVVVLDPFTVTTDQEGYKAIDTLAGGRIRTNLKDTPASLSVITKKLLSDLNVNNQEDLFIYTPSTEVSGLYGNYSGMSTRGQGIVGGGAEATRLTNPAGINRGRGLTAVDNTRNFFPTDIPWDGYNVSRVDMSRGPNSFLFGTGSPSGISNVATNEAVFKDRGAFEAHYASYGTTRESLDINKVLVDDQAAIRLNLVNDDRLFQQEPAFNHSQRAYGAIRLDPKFLRTRTAYTKIQASYEHGEVESNNPRILPPLDYLTGYLNDPAASPTGYNPWEYNLNNAGNTSTDHRYSLWAGAGSLANQYQWSNNAQLFYDAATGALLDGGQAGFTSPTGNGFGSHENTWNVHSVGYYSYARTSNYLYRQANGDQDGGEFAGAYRGTVRYFDKTLSDPSIFDFYHKLIDGDNKREWQRWDAYNVSVVQSLFEERLVIQGVVDHQEYLNGDKGILSNPWLVLDLNSHNLKTPTWLPGATTNPNVGRPLVFGDQGHHNINYYERDNYQATAYYNLDFERDFGMTGTLGRILGKQDFTGLAGSYDKFEEHRNYQLYGLDPIYRVYNNDKTPAQVLQSDNTFNWLAYTGPSLLGTSSAGANLSNLATPITVPSAYPFTVFSKEWTAGSAVDPAAPWTYTGEDGTSVTQVQADNPANYRGYTRMSVPFFTGEKPRDVLATGGTQRRQKITSQAFLYQGHFWDNTVIPTFGYRRDTTFQQGSDASRHRSTVTGIYDLNYNYAIDDPTGIEATTKSISYGVAVHLPASIKKRLPEGTDLTFYYFHGENETPKVRYGLDGSQLPNESGKTDDFSVQFDGLDGRLTARLTYFKTQNSNSSASVGQPLATHMVYNLPAWTLALHAYSMAHQTFPQDANGYYQVPSTWDSWTRESWSNWPYGWMSEHPAEAAAANQAMMNEFTELYPQAYWDAYGYNIDVEAIKRGDWSHVVKGTDFPYFPPQMGGGPYIHGEYPTIDQNLESKGFEFEVEFRPLRNWEIKLNASKVDATQTGLGAAATKQLTGMADVFLGSAVQYAGIWGGYEGAKNSFLTDIWAPYLNQVALIGGEQPEMRKYRFNAITNYRFIEGRMKGLEIGGAWRWEDKAIIGYGIHETEIYGETAWIANVDDPIYGPTESHFDAWIAYQRKLTDKIDWRVQLNARSVGENTRLVTAAVEPDGSVAQQRIMSGATYDLSMRFSF